jgi:hypothetical protein
MNQKTRLIVSEKKRSFIQIIIAAVLFTVAIGYLIYYFGIIGISNLTAKGMLNILKFSGFLFVSAIGFTSIRKVYIDLQQSKFRPVVEVLGFKFGVWTTINDYEYISVFYQHLENGKNTFEVNLWYDTNKHLELYRTEDVKEAFIFGYNVSEDLDIDFLDATKKESEWINKKDWLKKMSV